MLNRLLILALLLLSLTGPAFADGGRLRFSKPAGPFLITLFTSPEPLTPGPSDFSVMVQDAKTGNTLPDVHVAVQLTSDQGGVVRADASHALATNRLLQAAQFDIPSSGNWKIRLEIQQGTQSASLDEAIVVQPGSRKAPLVWTFALLPVLAIFLFILHQRQKTSLARRAPRTAA